MGTFGLGAENSWVVNVGQAWGSSVEMSSRHDGGGISGVVVWLSAPPGVLAEMTGLMALAG